MTVSPTANEAGSAIEPPTAATASMMAIAMACGSKEMFGHLS